MGELKYQGRAARFANDPAPFGDPLRKHAAATAAEPASRAAKGKAAKMARKRKTDPPRRRRAKEART